MWPIHWRNIPAKASTEDYKVKEPEGSEIDAIVEIDELNAYDLPSPLQRQRRGVVSTILHHKADPNAPVQSEVRGLPVLNIDSVGSFSRNQELSGNVFAIGDNEVSADEWARLLVQTQRRDIINMMLNYRADPSLLGATDSSPVDMAISDGMVFPPVGAESASQAESTDSKDTAAQKPVDHSSRDGQGSSSCKVCVAPPKR